MGQLQSDLAGASQKATALKKATDTLSQSVTLVTDTQTTIIGNSDAQQALQSSQDRTKKIARAISTASGNIQSVAKEFEALDAQIAHSLPKPLEAYTYG